MQRQIFNFFIVFKHLVSNIIYRNTLTAIYNKGNDFDSLCNWHISANKWNTCKNTPQQFFLSCKPNSLNERLFYTSNWPVTPKIKLHHADDFSCIILRIMWNDFIRATYKQKWQKIHKPNKTSCKTYEKEWIFYSDIDRLGKCFPFFIL